MNTFKLGLVATACMLALTACSSGKGKGSDYLNSEANQRIQALNARLDEAKKNTDAAEQKAREAERRAEAALTQQTTAAAAQTEQAAAEAKSALNKVIAQKDAVEKELADAKAQLAAIEKAKQDELDRVAAAEKAEKERVETNIAETQKAVKDNGTREFTYTKPGEPSFNTSTTEETIALSYVAGKQLDIVDGKLSGKDVAPESLDLNKLVVDGTEITLYSAEEIRTASRASDYVSKNIEHEGYKGQIAAPAKDRNADGFTQVRYGYVNKDGKTTLFVQGHTTPAESNAYSPFDSFYYGTSRADQFVELAAMPTSQVWRYQGSAFYGKDGVYQELAVDAVADFAERKVRADLKSGEAVQVTLGGEINGNQFSGTYNGVVTSGAFYGTKAQDMAGVFYQTSGENKDKNGVFGATAISSSPWRFAPSDDPSKTLADFQLSK